jgi:hypothetical protein
VGKMEKIISYILSYGAVNSKSFSVKMINKLKKDDRIKFVEGYFFKV